MEKYFIVTEGSRLRKEYFEYRKNLKIINEKVKLFTEKHGIEANGYCAYDDLFMISPTEKDSEKFRGVLANPYENGITPFKKSSKINKDWIKTLKENNLKVLHKPDLWEYFYVRGSFSTRLFDVDKVVYASMRADMDIKTPEGFTEIKASEFYKIIEECK